MFCDSTVKHTIPGGFYLSGNSATVSLMKKADIVDQLIAKNLRRIREKKSLSQAGVGALVGMDKDKISAYENAHIVMGKGVMLRFCKALNIDFWEFYWTENAPLIKDDYEQQALDRYRREQVAGVAEDVAKYGEYRIEEAKKKEGTGSEGKASGVPRRGHKRAV